MGVGRCGMGGVGWARGGGPGGTPSQAGFSIVATLSARCVTRRISLRRVDAIRYRRVHPER